jgi:hypothetical protein
MCPGCLTPQQKLICQQELEEYVYRIHRGNYRARLAFISTPQPRMWERPPASLPVFTELYIEATSMFDDWQSQLRYLCSLAQDVTRFHRFITWSTDFRRKFEAKLLSCLAEVNPEVFIIKLLASGNPNPLTLGLRFRGNMEPTCAAINTEHKEPNHVYPVPFPRPRKIPANSARLYQSYYDNALRAVGMRAPQPILGQSPDDYRRETLRLIKRAFLPQNQKFYGMQMRGLPSGDVLNNFEPEIVAAAIKEARNSNNVPPGELRKIEKFDHLGRVKQVDFIGSESFVKQMGVPGRRVTGGLLRADPAVLYRRVMP